VKQDQIIKGFNQLGILMSALGNDEEWEDYSFGVTKEEFLSLEQIVNRQISFNGWFTKENVKQSLKALGDRLNETELENWTANYSFSNTPKNIAVIMAGNIPLVGFHDFLSVLISGNNVVAKLSSDDKTLLPALAQHLITFVPELKERIKFSLGPIGDVDAVIATGSDNSLKFFKEYFGKYPHIFRRNRTSIAVLSGEEEQLDVEQLGLDIFSYFGLGCRNVSHILIPEGFEMNRFFEGVFKYSDVINNNKYGNNYDYNKTVYLMNKHELLDNNFVLLRESDELFSPLAMIHYHYYKTQQDIDDYIKMHEENIQAVVGNNQLAFGAAQCPKLNDYADGVDVMKWLEEL